MHSRFFYSVSGVLAGLALVLSVGFAVEAQQAAGGGGVVAVSDVSAVNKELRTMAGVIEGFRSALLGTTPMPWDLIGVGALSAVLVALSGALYFRRMERFFADVA